MASKNVLTIAAKMVGGRGIVKETDEITSHVDKMGRATAEADKKAGSGKGWALFSKHTKEAEKHTKAHGSSLHGAALGALKYGAGLAGVTGIMAVAKGSISDFQNTAEEVRQAHSLGLGGENQQMLVTLMSYKQRGIGMTQLSMSAKGLAKASYAARQQEEKWNLAQANAQKTGKASTTELGQKAKSFQQLGINIQQFGKMSGGAQLKAVSDALTKMPVGPERTRIATELLGKSAQKMLPVFTKGALGINAMEKSAREFLPQFKGGTKGFEEMEGAQLKLGLATEGLKLRIGMALLPVVVKLMGGLTKLYDAMSHGKGIWKTVGHDIGFVAGLLKTLYEWVRHSTEAQKGLVAILAALAVVWAVQKVVEFVKWVKALWLVTKLQVVATKAWAIAQAGLNLIMDANPIALAVIAVAALVAGFVLAYKKVGWFREGVQAVFGWIKKHWPILVGVLLGPFAFAAIEIIKHWHSVIHFFEGLPRVFAAVGEAIWSALLGSFKWMINSFILAPINMVIGAINKMATAYNDIPIHVGTAPHVKPIPMLGDGGITRSHGSVIVGERGPEWLTLPAGARVDPLPKGHHGGGLLGAISSSAGGSGDMHVHVEVAGRDLAQAVIKDFRRLEARSA